MTRGYDCHMTNYNDIDTSFNVMAGALLHMTIEFDLNKQSFIDAYQKHAALVSSSSDYSLEDTNDAVGTFAEAMGQKFEELFDRVMITDY